MDFSIFAGEMVGIIGANGAGKSTLLKLLSGMTLPSEGEIMCNGRVAALIELGSGFHPEWTGRENAEYYLRLRGLTPLEVKKLLPQVERFADIGRYFDQPIRLCSSGMAMRVAFAAAALVPCEILIVDEVLVVGDNAFIRKCFVHIDQLRARGVTVIFVTHRLDLVTQLCSRALYLRDGELVFDGPPEQATRKYWADQVEMQAAAGEQAVPAEPLGEHVMGVGGAEILDVRISGAADGQRTFEPGSLLSIEATVRFTEPVAIPVFCTALRTTEGVILFQTNSKLAGHPIAPAEPDTTLTVRMELPLSFPAGTIFVDMSIARMQDGDLVMMYGRHGIAELRIVGTSKSLGLVDLPMSWSSTMVVRDSN